MASKTIASLSLALFTQTADYVKGLKTAQGSTKAFEKGVKEAGKKAGDAFQEIARGVPQVNPLLLNLAKVVQAGVRSFQAMGVAAKGASAAFISTGIGAVVVALGVAFAALSSWISRTTDGADAAKTVWSGISQVFEEVLDRLSILGSAIGKFVTGDFAGAAKEIRRFWESTKTFVDDVNNGVRGSVELQQRENQLRKDKIAFIVREAELTAQIAELRRKAQESQAGFNEAQRLGFINKAIELQKQLGDEQRRIAQEEATIQSERIKLSDSNYDALQKEAELKAVIVNLSAREDNALRELLEKQKTMTALVGQEAANRRKAAEEVELQFKFTAPSLTETESVIKNALVAKPVEVDLLPRLTDEDTEGLVETERALAAIEERLQKTADVSSTAFDALGTAFDAAGQGAEGFKNSIRGVIKALLSQSIATAIANTLKGASGLLGFLSIPIAAAAGKGVAALFSAIVPSFATGGIMPYSGVALVGEQGPELVRLPKGSQVFNNSQTNQMLGGAQRVDVRVYGQLRGSDIYIANKEEARKRGNITG